MKRKHTDEFTAEEKEWMDTIAVNFIIAQADGFQLGYAQAIHDFTENIIDYWQGSDDTAQISVLDAIADLGVELGKRKGVAEKNVDVAKEKGYGQYYRWEYEDHEKPFSRTVPLFTKEIPEEALAEGREE